VVWKATKEMPAKPSPILVGDEIYTVNDKGIATCLDAATGAKRWIKRFGGSFSASPIFADGRIYFCSEDGKTLVLAPGKKFEQLASNQLDGRFMASPAVSGQAIFLRTDTHLYRIEKKEQVAN
jgi:outer membrane protein assembly factor BamB